MDLRPQAHEIIRTWLFSSVVRAHFEHDSLPWANAAISGWILDPDRKKMGKSKGNALTPMHLLDQYGSDAVRYWAASARPGVDTAFDESQMKVGRRLAIKLLNASKFVLGLGEPPAGATATQPLDRALLATLDDVVAEATAAFEAYDHGRALERSERFFWTFCDDYVELVKGRAYGAAGADPAASAQATLRHALSTVLRLFAPHLPFVTEEIWGWGQDGSIPVEPWPTPSGSPTAAAAPLVFEVAGEVLGAVRRAKSDAQVSLRAEVARVVVEDTEDRLAALAAAEADVREAGRVAVLDTKVADGFAVTVELAPPESSEPAPPESSEPAQPDATAGTADGPG
jgi:valyl-tRNA synthetase